MIFWNWLVTQRGHFAKVVRTFKDLPMLFIWLWATRSFRGLSSPNNSNNNWDHYLTWLPQAKSLQKLALYTFKYWPDYSPSCPTRPAAWSGKPNPSPQNQNQFSGSKDIPRFDDSTQYFYILPGDSGENYHTILYYVWLGTSQARIVKSWEEPKLKFRARTQNPRAQLDVWRTYGTSTQNKKSRLMGS